MKQFLKFTLASILGTAIVLVFMCFMSFLMLGAMMAADEGEVSLKNGMILRISLDGKIESQQSDDFFSFLLKEDERVEADELISAIREARTNDKIKGIYLEGGAVSADLVVLSDVRRELDEFKQSGKFVLAYADNYDQTTYYLASVADTVLLNPTGQLDWHGATALVPFYTELLEMIGVKAEVVKVGKFKGAVEPYLLTEMSPENRLQYQQYIDGIWNDLCTPVSASRGIPVDSLKAYAGRYMAFAAPEEYVNLHFIDALAYDSEVRDRLRSLSEKDKVKFVSPQELAKLAKSSGRGKNLVSVYYVEGSIVNSESPLNMLQGQQLIVADKVVKDLDELSADDDIKAVVLRVNSPGGDAAASERIWQAVKSLKEKKPVVVSMGDYAASGGYYISCGASKIYADPLTLTGSIGIYGLLFDQSTLLNDKLKIHFDVVKTNEGADFGNPGRSFTEQETGALQAYVDRGYESFLSAVAQGRGMTNEDVDEIAQGRIWTGRQALEINLVDSLGSLDDATAEAARMASLDKWTVSIYSAKSSWMEKLLETPGDDYMEGELRSLLGIYYEPLLSVAAACEGSGLQARMWGMPQFK